MKRLALTADGKMTYCSADEHNIGKGRCNHILHESGNKDNFLKQMEAVQNLINNNKKFAIIEEKDLLIANTLDGVQKKYYKDNTFFKQDSSIENGGFNNKREGLSEELSCILLETLGLKHAEYYMTKLVLPDGNVVNTVASKNFLGENESLVSIEDITDDIFLKEIQYGDEDIETRALKITKYIEEKTGLKGFEEHLANTIVADMILMNGDRHFGNIGLIYDDKEGKYKGFSPLYDHGDALLSDKQYDNLTSEDYDNDINSINYDLSTFGMAPTEDYLAYLKSFYKRKIKEDGVDLRLRIKEDDLYAMEDKIFDYENKFYNEEKVDRTKNILIHQMDIYMNMGLVLLEEE